MTALTAAPQGDFGANHANWGMRNLIEGPILSAYRTMHGTKATITDIRYEVIGDENRESREGTEVLEKIAELYENTAQEIKSRLVAVGHQPSHQEVIDELALLPTISAHLDDAMLAVSAKSWEDWREVYRRIVENQKLWDLEDRIVAKALHITYFWYENGIPTQQRNRTIVIDLPNSLAALFKE